MDFTSLDEIISHFNFDAQEAEEVRKLLKKRLIENHPDKHNGDFKNIDDKEIFLKIKSAIEFLEKDFAVSPLPTADNTTALSRSLQDLALIQKEEVIAEKLEKRNEALSKKVLESITKFHEQNFPKKITSAALATILTTIWAFPGIIKDHPILGIAYNYKAEFSILWITIMFALGSFWLKVRSIEKKDEALKRSYKLESTQNEMFRLFIHWVKAIQGSKTINNKRIITFPKDLMINFLAERYYLLNRNLDLDYLRNPDEIEKAIQSFENHFHNYTDIPRHRITPFFFNKLFPYQSYKIDGETAQLVAEIIIERLLGNGVIVKSSKKDVSSYYDFEEDI